MLRWIAQIVVLAFVSVFAATAWAGATQPCLQIDEKQQIEKHYNDAQGRPAVRLKDATHPVRGQTVLFTLQATNTCADAVEPTVIEFTLPQGMSYVLGSAGRSSEATFSINGKTYGKFEALAIHDGSGPRAARAEDIKSIRWISRKALAPNASRTVHLRATVL